MFAVLPGLFDTTGFPPRWSCGNWSEAHGWLHILSDLGIFAAYFAIPCVLVYFVRKRADVPFMPVFWLFAAFILSCGIGHAIEASLFWNPWYRLSGVVKLVTALVSWATVLALIPLVPKALALPGLARVNQQLRAEIERRERAEEERLRIERQMLQAQKLESLGVLAGGIAHDFNNLLTCVLGYTELARGELSPDSPAAPLLAHAETGARRAAELTNQMLAYSGRGRFAIEPVRLPELVASMGRLLQVSVPKKCELTVAADPGVPPIAADAAQVNQVVMNLVLNGAEALGEADGRVTVRVGVAHFGAAELVGTFPPESPAPGAFVFVEVSDTGCGMSEETKAKMFDPFFTTKFTGRGLGLAAVLGIVRAHKGAIRVDSAPGAGTTFKVLFPVGGDGEPLPSRAPAPAWRGSGAVLVIDDEEPVRELARAALARAGYEVETAADGRAGVDAFARAPHRFTLVLLDMTMPHLSGEEVLRELRRLRPDVPVLLTSGYTERAVRARTGPGAVLFLPKPFGPEELQTKVRELVGAG